MRQTGTNFKTKMFGLFLTLLALAIVLTPLSPSAQGGNTPPIIRDTEIENILREWTTPLLKASQIGENGIRIILVQSNEVNAFVAGGANLFLYTGLIKKTDSPAELIGVMAHEMGHIAGGHLILAQSALERASYESILGTVLGIGAAIVTGNGAAANAIIGGSQNVAARRFLAHSRVQESSADQAAFSYITRAGMNPSGLESFFEKLEDQELLPASQQSEYVRTHPITRDRIEAVTALTDKSDLKDKPYPAAWVEQHARMKAKLIGFINPEQVASLYKDDDHSVAAQYARTIAAYRLNDIPTATRGIDALIGKEPDNPYFQELKGQMLVDFGKIEEAIPYYRKAVKLLPNAPLLRIALAHALIESGNDKARLEEAAGHLDRALVTEQRNARAHRLMATAQGRLGHESLAKLHLAEEATLQGRLPYAKAQAEAALKGLETGSPEWIRAKDLLSYITNLEQLRN